MPTVTFEAKLRQGVRALCVDKNITANLSSSFSVGNYNRPTQPNDQYTIFPNILPKKIIKITLDMVSIASISRTEQRYLTYGFGNNVITPGSPRVIDNTNNWKVVSNLVCKFPTYIEIDVEKLGLPEGTDCIVQFDEGFVLEDRGRLLNSGAYEYPLNVQDFPSPPNSNFVTFRIPWFGVARLNSNFTIPNTILRIKQLSSSLNSQASVVAYGIFNPGKLAALFGGVFLTIPIARKTAVFSSTLQSAFTSDQIVLRIKQLASTFSSALATISAIAEKYKTPGNLNFQSTASISADVIRNIGVITAIVSDTAQIIIDAVKNVSAQININAQSSASITYTAQKGLPVTNMIMSSSLSITADVPMVLISTDTTVRLPLWYGNINAVIDWGDGTTQTVTSTPNSRTNLVKNYGSAGTRTIYIKGYIQHWGYQNAGQFLSNTAINSVGLGYEMQAFGDIGLETLIAFSADVGFNGVTPNYIPLTVTDISYFYYNQTSGIANANRLANWNTSNVTKMEGVFRLGQGDYSALPITAWDTGSVTTMRRMFRNSGNDGTGSTFNADISGWDVSNVTDMSEMFMDTNSFSRTINGWDVGNVVSFDGMFSRSGGTRYNQNLADWDTGSATNMNNMLAGTGTYTYDLSGWCVTNITTEPPGWTGVTYKPVWGTCPP